MLFWHTQLTQAQGEEELVRVVNDFLSTCTPPFIAGIAEPCRPHRVRDARDVIYCYERLADEYCDARADTSLDHRQMLAFFLAAVERHYGMTHSPAIAATVEPRRNHASVAPT